MSSRKCVICDLVVCAFLLAALRASVAFLFRCGFSWAPRALSSTLPCRSPPPARCNHPRARRRNTKDVPAAAEEEEEEEDEEEYGEADDGEEEEEEDDDEVEAAPGTGACLRAGAGAARRPRRRARL